MSSRTRDAAFHLRTTSAVAEMFEDLAAEYGSQVAAFDAIVTEAHRQRHPPVVVGYVRCDRPGELDDADCPECGQALKTPWLRFMSDGTFGVVCDVCATP